MDEKDGGGWQLSQILSRCALRVDFYYEALMNWGKAQAAEVAADYKNNKERC